MTPKTIELQDYSTVGHPRIWPLYLCEACGQYEALEQATVGHRCSGCFGPANLVGYTRSPPER
jgi:hypothetical protein